MEFIKDWLPLCGLILFLYWIYRSGHPRRGQ